jgi:gas vesicle protein
MARRLLRFLAREGEIMSTEQHPVGRHLLWAALFGGLIGAVVGALSAPASGEETRGRLSRRIGEGADSFLRRSQEAMEHAGSYARRQG